ncbi:MAG: efflux transporter outer membrane subunit [Sedimentisphaerales bacterium]|nr:efflux transporter outer membrane subunit [Sedimentisphaerales bacterium]
MKKRWIIYALSLVVISLSSVGCMVGPDYSRPETVAGQSDGFVHADGHNQDVNDVNDMDRWWEQFGDPITVSLVREALEKNYDLKAAAARVIQAQAAMAEASGRRWPDVSYSLGRDRSKVSFDLGDFAGGGRLSFISETWQQALTVNYILDVFGKLKRAERAAWADVLAAGANGQVLTNAMIANVINARISIATIQHQLALAKANTESLQKTLEIVERRYELGLVGPVDTRLAREQVAASKAGEPAIELSLIQARNALDVLLARPPGSSGNLPGTLSDLPDLAPVPIGIPASLLDRRPDVKAAELALRSANEMIGVSIAGLYPDLTLTGNYGASANRWRDIWHGFSETYSLTMGLAQPIFRGGQIRAQIKGAKARYAELAATYNSAVLTAMKEVEDALATEQSLQTQLTYVQDRLTEAKAAEELSRQRYQQGIEGILTVLQSERSRRVAEEQLIAIRGQIWTTRVNLYLALGGDWVDREKTDDGRRMTDGKKQKTEARNQKTEAGPLPTS